VQPFHWRLAVAAPPEPVSFPSASAALLKRLRASGPTASSAPATTHASTAPILTGVSPTFSPTFASPAPTAPFLVQAICLLDAATLVAVQAAGSPGAGCAAGVALLMAEDEGGAEGALVPPLVASLSRPLDTAKSSSLFGVRRLLHVCPQRICEAENEEWGYVRAALLPLPSRTTSRLTCLPRPVFVQAIFVRSPEGFGSSHLAIVLLESPEGLICAACVRIDFARARILPGPPPSCVAWSHVLPPPTVVVHWRRWRRVRNNLTLIYPLSFWLTGLPLCAGALAVL